MSIGYKAFAKKEMEDNRSVLYVYGSSNLNEPEYINEEGITDGTILIMKECFQEPEIHEKIKRLPSGRKKLITKRIPISVDYEKMIREGLIKVENCSNCWKASSEEPYVDIAACHLLFKMFQEYQEEGKVPEQVYWAV